MTHQIPDLKLEFVDIVSAPLGAIDDVVMRAYRCSSRRARIERFLRVPGGEWVVLRRADKIVSTGGLIAYPSGGFGWLGLIATDPDEGRQGLGRTVTEALLERLRERGCATALDGSAQGAPLYERMGFIDHGRTRVLSLLSPARPFLPLSGITYAAADDTSWADLMRYDELAFGANREALLRYIARESSARSVVLRMDGRIVAYGIAQAETLGPIVANDDELAMSVANALLQLPWDAPPTLIVPPESTFHRRAGELGFVEQRTLRRQVLGVDALPGLRTRLCAQISLGEG